MRSAIRITLLTLFFMSIGGSCSDAATQPIVDSIVISLGASLTDLSVGQTVQADAIARDAAGGALAGQTITWSSSDPAVATVSAAGVVTAVAPGTAKITGSAAGRSASVTVTVKISAAQLAVVTAPSATVQTGTVLAVQPAVQLKDLSGLPVAEAGVVVTAGGGPGITVGGTTTAKTDAAGIATFTDLTVSGLVGQRNLTFSALSLPVASVQLNVTVGPLAQLAFRRAPSTGGVSGDTMSIAPIVGLADAWTNAISQAGVPIAVNVASGPGALTGTSLILTNASGAATFSDLAIAGTGSYTLKFTTGTLGAATSDPIVVVTPIRTLTSEAYATTAAMLADCALLRSDAQIGSKAFFCPEQEATSDGGVPGYNAGDITLDPTVAAPGLTKSTRYHYNHPGDGCNTITLRRYIALPARQEFWSEFFVRWSSNFTTANLKCAPNDHKLIFGDTESELSGRWAFYVGSDGDQGVHTLEAQISRQPTVADGAFYLNRNNHGTPSELMAENLWDGNWHVIRLHMKMSTTTTSADGRYRIWIDGVLRHDQSGFNNFRVDGTTNPDKFWGIDFTHNEDDGPAGRDMYIWWGRVRIFGSDPGW